jgi:hypothetical protein
MTCVGEGGEIDPWVECDSRKGSVGELVVVLPWDVVPPFGYQSDLGTGDPLRAQDEGCSSASVSFMPHGSGSALRARNLCTPGCHSRRLAVAGSGCSV